MKKSERIFRILLLLAPFCFQQINAQEQQPNFLFILTDDQPYGSLGVSGNDLVQTPHLDQLAEEGVFFTNAHITSAICTPSRVSIFLSQYERKHGVNFNSGTSVAPEAWEDSYPMVLRRAGYYTGYVGKNHSPVGDGGYDSGLLEESFDYWYAGHGHLRFYPKKHHDIFKSALASTQPEILTEGALDFLNANAHNLEGALHFLDERPSDQPFCLSVCFNLPHGAGTGSMQQLETDPELYRSTYRELDIPMPENYVAKKDVVDPKLPPELHHVADRQTGYNWVDTPKTVQERLTRIMQAMTGIDLLVGSVRERLEELGVAENTVIVFSSDHGLFYGQQGLGGKALCYEACTHVPLIVFDPLMKKKQQKSIDREALVQSIDIGPTLLDLAGVEIPVSYQGKSLKELLDGKELGVRDYLFTENLWSTHFGNPRCEAVQDKHWKYIRYYENNNVSSRDVTGLARDLGIQVSKLLYGVHDPQIAVYRSFIEGPVEGEPAVFEEFYDLQNDPHELQNLAGLPEYKDRMELMRSVWIVEISRARGMEKPKVLRYTVQSMEAAGKVKYE